MADVSITAASVLPGANASLNRVTFGATVTRGMPVYKNADGTYYPAKANSTTTMPAVGVACCDAGAGQPGVICIGDSGFTPGFAIAAGTVYAVSAANAGGVCPIADVEATGDYVQVLFLGGASNTAQLTNSTYVGAVHA